MDVLIFLIVLAILIVLAVTFGIPYLTYRFFEGYGKRKLGRIISIGIFSVSVFVVVYFLFEDHFFFKYSARKELHKMDVQLIGDFEILKNESGGYRDYYHIFELKISNEDIGRLLKDKDSSNNYIVIRHQNFNVNIWKEVSINPKERILTYEYVIN